MMRVLFIFLLLFASGWLGVQLSKDPGYIMIAIQHWTIETTLWIGILAALLFFFLLYLLIHLTAKLFNIPTRWRNWLNKRRIRKARATTRQGLIEYSEGYWQKAKHHLIKALPNTDTPLLNYLTAARAAQKMGDNQLRDHYLREAQQSMPEAKIAVELTQAELQLANQQWEQALATLKHLQDLAPNHPYVLKLLMNLYKEVRDWPQLISLLPELKKHQVISQNEYEKLRLDVYYQEIKDLAKSNHAQSLEEFMKHLPKPLYFHPKLNAQYARFLLQQNRHEEAEKVLRQCLRKEVYEELFVLYGLCEPNTEQQLAFAESMLKKAPHSAALYLCLGRLALKSQLWGKAKNYLQRSIELHPVPENHAELGKLYEQLNEPFKASHCYKQGLELAIE
ncbi:protoporphyrinogen oxidase [Legionella israelensis]|uniref:heme biosynthesis HemY N-terminal domain-containing protein n=1 Tax=Legionella israelensis TaxID=454 RepID=UPI00117D2762|nr:heme biosynthesis HemY N-terminal domain-containing protein [Legionella israelensis]QDP71123.1 protoporphyrinogen oxidase [Legionella israelensis]